MLLSVRSEKNLAGVHPQLVAVVRQAAVFITEDEGAQLGFIVTEGLRTKERQLQLFNHGASRTLQSRHLTGHAVDLAATLDGDVRWDWPLYAKLAAEMKKAATVLKVDLHWGGDWETFKDGPHFEVDPQKYPF